MENFLVHNEEIKTQMCADIGIKNVDELFNRIPNAAKMNSLNLDDAISEMNVQKKIKALAKKNKTDYISFIGGGFYNKFIPACIAQISQRFEFLTAYTPYQPEISQGTLQIMYEFQTMMCRLTNMDVANATVYDAATACAEAILMSIRIKKSNKVLVSNNLNPEYKRVITTYANASNIDVEWFDELPQNTSEYSCVLIQTPNYFGEIEEIKTVETLLVICTDVSTLSILKPVECDIMIGDVQTLGIPMNFGGPSAGFMACKEKYMRQLPGRLAGRTIDKEGNEAYTLTIQTREQHIKREKATSNICSNQALIGLCATLYLSAMGEKGFKQAGYLSCKYAHKLSKLLADKGIKTINKNYFNEFTIKVNNADETLAKLKNNNILGGIKIDETSILVATTEMNSEEELDLYAESIV